MKKKRSDSTLAALNPQQKAQLRTWLVDENKSYEEVSALLHEDFNVQAGVTAVRNFYATDCFSLRSSEAKEFAERVVSELQTSGQSFDTATLALVKQKAFERAYAKNGNIEELATLAKIIGDSAKLELKRTELSISRETLDLKVRQYEEKIAAARTSLEKAKSKGGVSPETLKLIEEQLKLL
jgi:cysteinyl-tRNA synthetase